MNMSELRQLKPQILAIASKHGMANIRVFGSVARGEANEKSDVDLLVTPHASTGMEFFRFCMDMETMLQCKVDVISDRAINRHIKQEILSQAQPL